MANDNEKIRVVRNMPRIITNQGTYVPQKNTVSVAFTNQGTVSAFVQQKEVLPKETLTFGDENSNNFDRTEYSIYFSFNLPTNKIIMMSCLLAYE